MKAEQKKIANITRYLNRQEIVDNNLAAPDQSLEICIVIPAYYEEKLEDTLRSIAACNHVDDCVEVIIVLNSSQGCGDHIREFHQEQLEKISQLNLGIALRPILLEHIPKKKAGVGLARKTGMDLALWRLSQVNPNRGIIVCLDGDCEVSRNYIAAIKKYFAQEESVQAIHLYFEHVFPEDPDLFQSIIAYEMHLRLMKLNIQKAGHPQAFHAVGSCLAVKAWAYAAQGGMNSRQAGEDFYFIHKFSKIGQLAELKDATVYPSARESSRVPFGTGAAIKKSMGGSKQLTYHPEAYKRIEHIMSSIPEFYHGNKRGVAYFGEFKKDEVKQKLKEIRSNTTSLSSFRKRFIQWFDAFQVIKFLHYLRDEGLDDVTVEEGSKAFFYEIGIFRQSSLLERLLQLRKIDKQSYENNNSITE